jgi:uncharacterized protein
MIVDSNAYLGHWAFRRLRYNTGEGLLELMDRVGIDRACVSSASAIMYRNSHVGNEELLEEIDEHRERLIPFAVLNPTYPGWERDLRWCKETLGAKGLRLYPPYHDYGLDEDCCHEMVDAAAELGMVIEIPITVHDLRQSHWLVEVSPVAANDIAALVADHPAAKFVILQGNGFTGSELVTQLEQLPANYWFEMSLQDSYYRKELQQMKESVGAERLVFGTGICFRYPEPAFVRMEGLQATAGEKEMIFSGNMLGLLGDE